MHLRPTTMKGYYNKPDETDMILRRHPDGRIWAHRRHRLSG
ncbi:MAG: hypothetical protein ACLUIR_03665 [Faecalibacterium prausnitzii]